MSTAAGTRSSGFVTRALRGFTPKRFAIFCGLVAMTAIGHGITNYLFPDKTLTGALKAAAFQFGYMFALFGMVWVAVVIASNLAPPRTLPKLLVLAAAVAVALVAFNQVVHSIIGGFLPERMDEPTLSKQISALVLWSHVIAAFVLGYFFLTREEETVARLNQEEMQRIEQDRELAEARLQVMQAQVEPHFLFNTLANVRRLFQTDPAAAHAMLEHLSRYLSAMLPRMRSTESTLGHELDLALAYLQVQQIRMGPRLAIRTDVPEPLLDAPFPPMMLVTLVENAIRHGLNPLPEGGEVRIVARATEGRLRIQVIDTGRGMAESSGSGVGLANIRARLSTLFGGRARLLLAQNPGAGVSATIELPHPAPIASARAA